MKMLSVIAVWLIVAGVLLGCVVNNYAERCGEPATVSTDDLVWALSWPVILAAAFVIERENLGPLRCEAGDSQ